MSDHMKRLAAPKTWPINRKANVFSAKQIAGSHSVENSIPAVMMLRDVLKVCDTSREATRIIADREFLIDGKAARSIKAPVGLMDVIAIPKMDMYFRVLISDKGKITAVKITKEEASWKLCRIENKTKVSGGKIQLNLHDGRNVLIDKNQYKPGDVVKLEVPTQKIVEAYELAKGANILVCSGNHAGKSAVIDDYIIVQNSSANVVKFTDGSETVKDNVFVIGSDKPAIKLPEVSA